MAQKKLKNNFNFKIICFIFLMLVSLLTLFAVKDNAIAATDSTKLTSLNVVGYTSGLSPNFDSNVYSYDIYIGSYEIDLDIDYVKEDEDANVEIIGNKYITGDTGSITINVQKTGVPSTNYQINYTKVDVQRIYNFDFTGGEQTFIAPLAISYKLEVWGAQGGDATSYNGVEKLTGGYGGYSTGVILLKRNDNLFVNVGGAGYDEFSPSHSYPYETVAGGYNGGGAGVGGINSTEVYRIIGSSGGGATHIASTSGVLSSLSNQKSKVIIVAGGGGGSLSHRYNNGNNTWRGQGGHGGGFKSTRGISYGRSTSATSATQTEAGCGYDSNSGNGCGSFGLGQSGNGPTEHNDASGAGGGYWGGGASQYASTSGGSGFINSNVLISSNNIEKHMTCFLCETSNESSTKTISTTNRSSEPISDYAKIDDGYARITALYTNKNNYLTALSSSVGSLSPSFEPTVTNYNLHLTKFQNSFKLSGVLSDNKAFVSGLDTVYEIDNGETKIINVIVTSEDGAVKEYKITATRDSYNDNHSSKLSKLIVTNYENDLNPSFSSTVTYYSLTIDNSEIYLDINYDTYDPEATVSISGNERITSNSGTVTITVSAPSVSNTEYKINYTKSSILKKDEFKFTGSEEVFVAPKGGYYKLEAWGASGGYATSYNYVERLTGGKGGYSVGVVKLKKGDKLYVNVGEHGIDNFYPQTPSTSRSSYNGGGSAAAWFDSSNIIHSQLSGGGGGATSIAKSSGLLSSLENSTEDVLLVAAGGGGATSHRYNDSENIWRGTGGDAGGYISNRGLTYGRSTPATPATQTEAGCGYNNNNNSSNGCGSFGQGQNSTIASDINWTGGAGGGYYGGGASNFSGSSGGSSYIANEELITYKTNEKHMTCYNCSTSDELDIKTISTTNSSEDPIADYAKDGDGYAKITLLDYLSKDNYLTSITSTYGTLSPTFSPTTTKYNLTLDKYDQNFRLNATVEDENAVIDGINVLYTIEFGETKEADILVTSESGDVRIYTITAKRARLADGEHSSKLSKLVIKGYEEVLDPDFNSLVENYNVNILENDIDILFELDTYDSEATYEVIGNKFIRSSSGVVTIKVTEPHVADTYYYINYTKDLNFETNGYDYTGSYQVFEAPWTMKYKMEVWGANGGTARCNGSVCGAGGGGGYASGILEMTKGEKVYIFVGQQGENSITYHDTRTSYNGGGYGTYDGSDDETAGGGGGATDIRYFLNEDDNLLYWDNPTSLASRIMVAGGAGGANWYGTSGYGGGLTGGNGSSTGGTQTNGYAFGIGQNATGRGGSSSTGAPGAGGGYYGGYSVNSAGVGAGGSGYVSGFLGSVAISSEYDTSARYVGETSCLSNPLTEGCSYHYSGKVFEDAVLLGGNEEMPTHDGTSTMTGNAGNGYAKITPHMPSKDNYLINLTTSVGTLSPSFDSIVENYDIYLTVDDTEIELRARPSDDLATIEGLGEFEVPPGDNTFEIKVTAESGDVRIYKVTTHREASNESKARNIEITGLVDSICGVHPGYCVQDPEFNENNDYYTLTVPSGIREIELTVTKKHYFETVIGDGVTRLLPGDNYITIEITSEDGNEMSLYTYEIYRDTSDDNYIDELVVRGIDKDTSERTEPIDIGFNFLITEYAFRVDNNITSLDLDITLDDPDYAEVLEIRGNENFKVGNNIVEIDVKARNNEVRTYIFNVYRLSNNNPLLSYLHILDMNDVPYDINPEFRDIITNYTLTVENDVTSVKAEADVQEETTTITGTGTYNLRVGINEIKITTTAEDGTVEVYKVIVTRKKNSNNYLSELSATYGPFNESFDKENPDYTITVEAHTKSLNITATPEVSTSKVVISGNSNFTVGENLVTITVTAENGDVRSYYIVVTKEGSDNDYLSAINLSAGILNPIFDKEEPNYSVHVSKDVSSINITGTAEDSLSTVQGNGTYNLIAGVNNITITVISELGSVREYHITVTRDHSENNYLSDIIISSGVLSPEFDREEPNYTINVESNVSVIDIRGILEDSRATITGNGIYQLQYGDNYVTLKVVAENGSLREYFIKIVRDKSVSTNLKKLIVQEGMLSPKFDKMVVGYTVKVPNDITRPTIIAIPEDDDSIVTIDGPLSMVVGDNTYTVTVTAKDDSTKVYTINVIRQEISENDLTLKTLDISSCSISYQKNVLYYECEVPYEASPVTVTAVPEDSSNTVVGTGSFDLEVGENLLGVSVINGSLISRDYSILITRKESTETRLDNIIVKNGSMAENFVPDDTEYNITTKYKRLELEFEKKHEGQKIEVIGNESLSIGTNEVSVIVTSADGNHTKTYNLHVNKIPNDNPLLKHLSINGHELSPKFDKGIFNYYVQIEYEEASVVINAIPEYEDATVAGAGMHSIGLGLQSHILMVTAEDGLNSQSYQIHIYRKLNPNNYLSSLSVEEYTLSPEFDKLKSSYTVRVPYEKDKVVISATPEYYDTRITGIGEVSLKRGSNKFLVTVTAQDGSIRTYQLNIIRDNPVTSLLENIQVRNYLIEPEFDPETLEYSVTVDNEVTSLEFIISKLDPGSTYVINGNQDFEVGINLVEIVSTSSDGQETTTYKIYVNRQAYSNTYLKSLNVSGGVLNPSFDKTILSYSVELESTTTEATITAAPENASCTVEGTGVVALNTGDNLFKVIVTSPTNVKRTYLVNIIRKSSNANIRRIETNIGNITRESDEYFTLVVPKGTTIINKEDLNIILEDLNATIIMDDSIDLNETMNYLIKVTSPDGKVTKDYLITVEYLLSNNYYIKSLVPSDGSLSPNFEKTHTSYTLEVDEDLSEVRFDVELDDEFATLLTNDLVVELNGYTTTKEFIVQAENGEILTYQVTINRSITKQKYLDDIIIHGISENCPNCEIPEYNETTYEYSFDVHYNVTDIEFEVIKKHPSQNVKIYKNNKVVTSYPLDLGVNTYVIKVTNSLNEVTTYTYNINRLKNDNNYLARLRLTVPEIELEDFDKNKLEYEVTVPYSYENIEVEAIPEDTENATVKINGVRYLLEGENDVVIKVTAMNKEVREYVIHVLRKPRSNNLLKTLTISSGDIYILSPKFRSGVQDYQLEVGSVVNRVQVEGLPDDEEATVYGNGEFPLKIGLNKIEVKVESAEGDIRTYTVNITRRSDKNVYLEYLRVNNGVMHDEFNKQHGLYDVSIANEYSALDLSYAPEDPGSTVVVTGNSDLVYGENLVYIRVTSSDKSASKTYTLVVYKEGERKNELLDIKVNEESIPGFRKDIPEYNLEVDNIVGSAFIEVTKESEFEKVSGLGSHALEAGKTNKIEITVTAQNGDKKIYTINIYRKKNNYLTGIVTDKGELSPEFSKTNYDYRIYLPNEARDITVIGEKEDSSAVVTGSGKYNLEVGENVIVLGVTNNEDTRNYKITVVREGSHNTYLSYLTVAGAIMDPDFEKEVEDYNIIVPSDVYALELDYRTEDETSTVEIIGNYSEEKTNDVILRVTSTAGDTRDYTLHVTREDESYFSNRLLDLTVNKGTLSPRFDPDTLSYTVTVDQAVSKIMINATKESRLASVEGVGEQRLVVGRNVFEIVVTSKDNKKRIYTLIVYRKNNSDARLEELEFEQGALSPTFNKNVYDYVINISNDEMFLDIKKIKAVEEDATIEIKDSLILFENIDNLVRIEVTSPNKSVTKTYTVRIVKSKSSNNYLRSLGISVGTLNPDFDKTVGIYTVGVDETVNSVNVAGVPESNLASVSGIGLYQLRSGNNYVNITVTAENGETRVYTIKIIKGANTNNYLKTLEVRNHTITPNFDKTHPNYTLEVEHDEENVVIVAEAEKSSSEVSGAGIKTLKVGENEYAITVTSEDKIKRVYTLTITRKPLVSTRIKDLWIEEGVLSPDFAPDTKEYTVLVPNEYTEITEHVELEDELGSYVIRGFTNLKVGSNTVTIEVTSSNNEKDTYTLNVIRQSYANTYLKNLVTSKGALSPAFDKTKQVYEISVPSTEEKITLIGTAEDTNAQVIGNGEYNLEKGLNTVVIRVKSQSGIVRDYQIRITREKSNNNFLSLLEVEGYSISPSFVKTKEDYTLSVDKTVDEVLVVAYPEDNESEISGDGIIYLETGENIVKVTVTAEDGSIKIYTVTITKEADDDLSLISITPSEGTLSPDFSNEVEEYTITVGPTTNVVDIDIVTNSNKAIVLGNKDIIIDDEDVERIVTIRAENKDERTIKFTITKSEEYTYIEVENEVITMLKGEEKAIVIKNNIPSSELLSEVENNSIVSINNLTLTGLSKGTSIVTLKLKNKESVEKKIVVNVYGDEIESSVYEVATKEKARIVRYSHPEPRTTIDTFVNNLDNDISTIKIYDKDDNLIEDYTDIIKTGMKVKLEHNSVVYDEAIIIVSGDVDENGLINVTDQSIIQNHIVEIDKLNDYRIYAMDLSLDDLVNVTDQVEHINYLISH